MSNSPDLTVYFLDPPLANKKISEWFPLQSSNNNKTNCQQNLFFKFLIKNEPIDKSFIRSIVLECFLLIFEEDYAEKKISSVRQRGQRSMRSAVKFYLS